ncbi:MFS transporter [Ruania halotolerans]|uniref:MFS transporter n=1 Tax=Ruania halotolerans TaxID=2897773 RepID=UPI001E2CF286|nr:MFS transporter [Ruania halotolerans]UFU05944.1 MFS transporter [Ruania halotolerans]
MLLTTRRSADHRSRAGLAALSLGSFGIGLTEFILAGLLSPVARDLDVSLSAAGQLVTGYALAVVVGAVALTPLLLHRPPRNALVLLMGLFVAGNLLSAFAPDYSSLMVGRVIAALCHGGFFGIGAVVAGDMVRPDRRAGAIAGMFAGLTLANVLGVPLGTLVGQQYGWRATFWLITLVGVIALVALRTVVPRLPPRNDGPLRSQFAMVTARPVLASIALTAAVFGGVFGAFTYIEPLLTSVSGFDEAAVPWLLVLFGVGLVVGNVIGGRAADRNLAVTLATLVTLLPLVLAGLALVSSHRVPTAIALTLLGLVGFATVAPLQLRVLSYAARAPIIASATNIAAFNLGNTIGVAAGGYALAGFGLVAPVWTGACLCLLGFLLLVVSTLSRKARR